MKLKDFIVIIVVATLVVGLCWLARSKKEIPEKAAAVTMPAKTNVPKQVELPASALPASKAATTPAATFQPSDPNAYAKAELVVEIKNIAQMNGKGELLEKYKSYTPPNDIDPKVVEMLKRLTENNEYIKAQAPEEWKGLQELMDSGERSMAALEDQTPTFNATGDEATYMYAVIDAEGKAITRSDPIVFIKINGKWYIKPATKSSAK